MSTIHLVPHTHWDREWYLPFQVFRIKLVHLVDSLLDLLDEEPASPSFTLDGQAVLLEDYLAVRPGREGDLRRHVQSGRLIVGPWYILADEFLVSPEALVRNLLLGRKVCQRFGEPMPVGYLPDLFGHIGQMPQILRGFGLQTAALRRGLGDEPCELWWEAPDGSHVLTAYLRDGYDNAARMPTTSRQAFAAFVREKRDSLAPHCTTSQILLLNGTDHHELQPEVPALAAQVDWEPDELRFSTLPDYLNAVAQEVHRRGLELTVVQGELRDSSRHHLLAGVLSSRVWIKQRNHRCETLLERWAEPFTAWAEVLLGHSRSQMAWTGHLTTPRVRRPQDLIREAWRLLLTCHPHDSICGCSVDQVHEEMRTRFDQAEQIAEEITQQSLRALAAAVDTTTLVEGTASRALVVFNPHQATHSDWAQAELELAAGLDPFALLDAKGRQIPYRLIERSARPLADMELDREGLRGMLDMVQGGRVLGLAVQSAAVVLEQDRALIDLVLAEGAEPNQEAVEAGLLAVRRALADAAIQRFRLLARFATRVRLEFVAPRVPGLGFRALALASAASPPQPPALDDGTHIENELLRVEAAPDGTLTLIDKESGASFPGLLRFRDQADRGDSYTFCPVAGDTPIEGPCEPPHIKRARDACAQSLHIRHRFRIPARLRQDRAGRSQAAVEMPIQVRATLAPGIRRLDLEIRLDNTAQDHRLQVLFPFGEPVKQGFFDGAYHIVRHPTTLPEAGPDWAEQPTRERPMRHFVAVHANGRGLMVAARGLREAAVTPQGIIAVTLLRATGWLSRDDLATRKGGAGPPLATPGGQVPGPHAFHLSLIPFQADLILAAQQAYAFQTIMRGVDTGLHPGSLPAAASLVHLQPESFALTACKLAQDGFSVLLRGVNLRDEPLTLELETLSPLMGARRARLDETPSGSLDVRGSQVRFAAGPHEVVTLLLHPRPASR